MKPALGVLLAASIVTGSPAVAQAQPPAPSPLVRGDVAGTIGWLNGNQSERQTRSYNDWYNEGLYLGVVGGWYWTDHLKTQAEAGLTNTIDFWAGRERIVNNLRAWSSSQFTFQLRRAAIGQHYQFFRNQWVHPHVGAGVDLTWERVTERAEPLVAYDPVTGRSVILDQGGVSGPTTSLRIRPYGEVGIKVYVSPRAFFRGDARVLVRDGFDELVFRGGFGIDF